MASPLNTNVSWLLLEPGELVELELVELELAELGLVELGLAELLLLESEAFKSIQGTATCLPPAKLALLELPRLLPLAAPKPLLALLGEVELLELGLVVLDEPGVAELLELPDGLVEPPVLPELLNETIAKSIRPEVGLIMQSLIVPSWLPDELVT